MKNVNNFKVSFFENQLKKGWQMSEFCSFFDLPEDELLAKLKAKYPSKTYQRLARKIKKDSSHEVRKSKVRKEIVEEEDNDSIVDESEKDETVELALTIEEVSANISKLEAEKKEISEKKKEYLKGKQEETARLQEAKNVIENIRKEIQKQESIIQSVRDKLSNLDQKIISGDGRIEEIEVEIEMLQERKKDLDKVAIKVLRDSTIECQIPVPDSWKNTYLRITMTEEPTDEESVKLMDVVELLNVKTVKVMSKIFSIIEELQKLGKNFKIVFEEETDLAVAIQIFECFEVEIINKE